jgi:hypothetical protein
MAVVMIPMTVTLTAVMLVSRAGVRDIAVVLTFTVALPFLLIVAHWLWPRIAPNRTPPIQIELDAFRLTLRGLDPSLQLAEAAVPRRAIYEVKFAPHSGNLVIRAHGFEMIDFRPVDNDRAMRWIADTLQEVLLRSASEGDATSASPSG